MQQRCVSEGSEAITSMLQRNYDPHATWPNQSPRHAKIPVYNMPESNDLESVHDHGQDKYDDTQAMSDVEPAMGTSDVEVSRRNRGGI